MKVPQKNLVLSENSPGHKGFKPDTLKSFGFNSFVRPGEENMGNI